MSVVEEVREMVTRALPDQSAAERVIVRLLDMGLRSRHQLKYVKEKDLEGLIPILELRNLLDIFKMEADSITLDFEVLPTEFFPISPPVTPSPGETSQPSPQPSQPSPQPARRPWPESFQVPWNLMPSEIRSAITSDKRPSPAARRQFVRIIADEMRKCDLNPSRAECLTVCQSICHQYPNSFADFRENGQLLDGGYLSLLIQVKNRLENLNRNSTVRQYRVASNGQKRGPTDTYGCTQFQPSLPNGESEESMESKRQQLEGIYSHNGIHGADRAEVKQLMDITFYLQHRHVNAMPSPTLAHLKTKWPYLFTQKGMISHFQLLTNVSVLRTIELSMEDCGNIIVEMFKAKPTNARVKEILNADSADLPYKVIKLLFAHFCEDIAGLILQADGCVTIADLESSTSLPVTPRLILLGEPQGIHQKWMISAEQIIVCEGSSIGTFTTGLATCFSVFYNFNLHYQEEAACCLEFIQRCLVGINPERGTKANGKKRRSTPPQVSSLLRKLMDYGYALV